MLGGFGHWTESQRAPAAFGTRSQTHTIQRERLDRVGLVNQILSRYSLRLSSWSSQSYLLRSATGKQALVENLSQLWNQADQLSAHLPDPLDDELLDHLTRLGAANKRD